MTDKPRISIIVAAARNGVIGRDNELPWRLSEDLKRFKRLTTGHAVIMGRRTFESIGRPLPNRRNIVLTRRGDFQPAGVTVRRSLHEAVDAAGAGDEVFIIGGEQVYREALPLADRVYLTRVEAEAAGDATFPALEEATWREVERDRREADEANEHSADYLVYDRRHD